MKKLLALVFAVVAFPLLAFAHGDKVDMTGDGISAALKKFTTENAGQMSSFSGVKGWLDGDKIMVKVYLTGNATITYSCTMMEMGGGADDMITCNRVQ